jgi:DNA-binding transcriptional regulator YhcF (GntR family)
MRQTISVEPVYVRLANLLEEMIRGRSLRPGDRVPSVRHFSEQQRVSVPTALHAYTTLETRGLIEARRSQDSLSAHVWPTWYGNPIAARKSRK